MKSSVFGGALLMGALVPLFLSSSLAAETGQRTVRFAIERTGLNFTGPCSALAYAVDRGKDANEVVENISDVGGAEMALDPGRYHVVVRCPSTEGAFSQTFPVDLRKKDRDLVARLNPGFVLANVTRNTSEAKAKVRVFDAFGRKVSEGGAKSPLPAPVGRHVVKVVVVEKFGRKKLALAGEAKVKVVAGARQNVSLDLSDATVTVDLRDNGKKTEGLASLMIPGTEDRAFELRISEPSSIPPGTYDLVTQLDNSHDFHTERKRNIKVKPGKTITVRGDHKTGGVLPKMRQAGKSVVIGEKGEAVDVLLYLGAAPKPFNVLDGGEAARLKPGKYRVGIRRKEKLADGSDWMGTTTVNVSRGGTRPVTVDVTPARWTITTTLAKAPKAMKVEVFTETGTTPLFTRDTGAGGQTEMPLGPGAYRATVTLALDQGPLSKDIRVVLKKGQKRASAVRFSLGVATIQVMDNGVAVPADVSFFARGTAAATLKIKAGRDAQLPPGRYTITVTRRGKTKGFGEVAVNERRPLERTLDFSAGEDPKSEK